jgi:sugar phosphate isomerase/epimerase
MATRLTRKQLLSSSCAAVLATSAIGADRGDRKKGHRFEYGLNTSTIRGQKIGIVKEIEAAAKAGYDAIEPWTGTISRFVQSGGKLADLRKQCSDAGLKVCSAIGFARWVVDDDKQRSQGIEQLKKDMDMLAQIGGTHIAASPAGANRKGTKLDLDRAAERYRAILEIGRKIGVTPQVEVWGPSANLSHVAEAVYVAAKSGHPDACVLSDAYHMYKGGTEPSVMKLLGRGAVHCFHMNDYPADPPRDRIGDSDRIWPGDGIAPLREILGYMAENHCNLVLSLELFNKAYWKMDPLEAATTGLAKMKAAVKAAGLG